MKYKRNRVGIFYYPQQSYYKYGSKHKRSRTYNYYFLVKTFKQFGRYFSKGFFFKGVENVCKQIHITIFPHVAWCLFTKELQCIEILGKYYRKWMPEKICFYRDFFSKFQIYKKFYKNFLSAWIFFKTKKSFSEENFQKLGHFSKIFFIEICPKLHFYILEQISFL